MKAAAVIAVLAAGCTGVGSPTGSEEPMRVRAAVFKAGALPGTPPADGEEEEAAAADGPAITVVETVSTVVAVGQVEKHVDGRTTTDAAAVAVALDGLGTGYWLMPVGAPDPVAGGEYQWSVSASFAWDVPTGPGSLLMVAIDGDGRAGQQTRLPICVVPAIDDNLNACNQDLAPPDTVLSLSWDSDVDLDLQVRTPEGKLVDADHPTTVVADGAEIPPEDLDGEHVGVLTRDSNADCRIDGINREDLVWQTSPDPGVYLVYANLSDACGQGSVRFAITVYRSEADDGGAQHLVEIDRREGQLLGLSANGGAGAGLFLSEFAF